MRNDAVKTTIPRAFLAVVTLGVLIVLTGLAYASPPDASWIPGIYDNADLDDVVVLVKTASGVGLRALPPPGAEKHRGVAVIVGSGVGMLAWSSWVR
jgi:hypothetical protein